MSEKKFLLLVEGSVEDEFTTVSDAITEARAWLEDRYGDAQATGELHDEDLDIQVVQVLWTGEEQYESDMEGIEVDTDDSES